MSRLQNLFSFVSTLGGVRRFSILKQVHAENVLEHTGMVAIFAYALATQINDVTAGVAGRVNVGLVLSRAIVHDFDEVVTGDVVRPTKYHSAALREAFKVVEAEGVLSLNERLCLPGLIDHHQHAKDGREGYLVAFADQMAAAHHVWSEVMVCGNLHMAQPAKAMREIFSDLSSKIPIEFSIQGRFVIADYSKDVLRMLDEVIAKPNPFVSMS